MKFKKGKVLVDSVFSKTGASLINIESNDQVLSIDGNKLSEVYYYSDFFKLTVGDSNSYSNIKLIRDKDTLDFKVQRKKKSNFSLIPIPNSSPNSYVNNFENGLKLFDIVYPDSVLKSKITENGIR